MGGGGAVRAAAKVAGLSVNGGLRSATSSVTSSARSFITAPSIEDGKSAMKIVSSQSGRNNAVISSGMKASWEIDDWEFAGGEEEFILDSMNPKPRVVFGSVPSLEEAKEATSELKDALDKVYFTSDADGSQKSTSVVESSTQSLQNSGHSETKTCVSVESTVSQQSSLGNPALQAFSLLKENPAAQGVVAALACDKNIWDAVMQNVEVLKFIEHHHTSSLSPAMDMYVKSPSEDQYDYESEASSENKEDEKVSGKLLQFIQEVRVRVQKMVSDFSGLIQNLFGGPTYGNMSVDGNGNATIEKTLGASFTALATLAIMVIVLKRG